MLKIKRFLPFPKQEQPVSERADNFNEKQPVGPITNYRPVLRYGYISPFVESSYVRCPAKF
jgi:hypothetical protein